MGVMFGGHDCYMCGKIKDLDELRAREIWVESGKSGGSMTFRGSRYGYNGFGKGGKGSRTGGGASYNTGRVYYKKQKVFICEDCLHEEYLLDQQRRRVNFSIFIILVAALGYFLFLA